jgi:hypothetical protein
MVTIFVSTSHRIKLIAPKSSFYGVIIGHLATLHEQVCQCHYRNLGKFRGDTSLADLVHTNLDRHRVVMHTDTCPTKFVIR